MSGIPWWVNFTAGIVCLALGINFIAQAYGLRLGYQAMIGKPVDSPPLHLRGGIVPLGEMQNNKGS